MRSRVALLLSLALVPAAPLIAQNAPTDVRNEILGHFEDSADKMMQLSAAIPADKYTWSPGEGVMSIARVYMHIARYNYMYLDEQLGVKPGLDYRDFESITDKAQVVKLLGASIEHVRKSVKDMGPDVLATNTRLYGRSVPGWAVLTQLVAHMNEHVGQSIAYARMNGIVPPWSR